MQLEPGMILVTILIDALTILWQYFDHLFSVGRARHQRLVAVQAPPPDFGDGRPRGRSPRCNGVNIKWHLMGGLEEILCKDKSYLDLDTLDCAWRHQFRTRTKFPSALREQVICRHLKACRGISWWFRVHARQFISFRFRCVTLCHKLIPSCTCLLYREGHFWAFRSAWGAFGASLCCCGIALLPSSLENSNSVTRFTVGGPPGQLVWTCWSRLWCGPGGSKPSWWASPCARSFGTILRVFDPKQGFPVQSVQSPKAAAPASTASEHCCRYFLGFLDVHVKHVKHANQMRNFSWLQLRCVANLSTIHRSDLLSKSVEPHHASLGRLIIQSVFSLEGGISSAKGAGEGHLKCHVSCFRWCGIRITA